MKYAGAVFLAAWTAYAAYIMSTALPSDLPTWLRLVANGLVALTIILRLFFGPPGGFIVWTKP